jgi:general L-amino acid transport system substrate-binding protein
VFAGDIASLDAQREMLASPEAHMVLGEVIGIAPLGPAVRTGDPQWADIVRWTLFALIAAEDMGLASDTIDNAAASDSALAQRFIGAEGALGKRLGLDPKWAYNVVATIGNYRELFARNLGDESPLDRERRLNQLWREGGLLSAPTFR